MSRVRPATRRASAAGTGWPAAAIGPFMQHRALAQETGANRCIFNPIFPFKNSARFTPSLISGMRDFPLTKHKIRRIAPIDLINFNSAMDYLATVKKKDDATPHAMQSMHRAYTVRRIDQSHHIDEIYQANIASEAKQARPME